MPRPKKPATIKILEGTYRKDRDGPVTEAVNAGGLPTPPDFLKGKALECWNVLFGLIEPMRILAACDGPMLALMSSCYAEYLRVDAALRKVSPAKPGYITLSKERRRHWADFYHIASRFGLTPTDRNKLRILPQEKKGGGVMSRDRSEDFTRDRSATPAGV